MAQGHFQMPRFQREFVWPVSKTRSLLDSMFKEFPIGTLFFWQAPGDYFDIFRELKYLDIPSPEPNQAISFILDGQQRLTSLFAAGNSLKIGNRDYGNVCIDLERAIAYEASHEEGSEEEIFVSRRAPDNERYVTFSDILSGNLDVYDGLSRDAKEAFSTAKNRFTNYPFSVVWVRDQPLAEVVEIFQRINQGGKRLSSYDLVCANLWTEDFNFRNKVTLLSAQLIEKDFEKVDEQIFPQAISLILRGTTKQSVQLRLKTEDVDSIWNRLVEAVFRSVDFARTNMGVKRASFLPYRGILPVLIYYFYYLDGKVLSAKHRNTLWQWFWRVSLSERYSANSQSRITEDVTKIRDLLDDKAVTFDYVSKASPEVLLTTSIKSTSSALRNTVLCMLALREPRNFKDGSQVNLSGEFFSTLTKAERHRIFPLSLLRKKNIDSNRVHSICNFAFIPSELNPEISSSLPAKYLAEFKEDNSNFSRDINSHLIPVDDDSPIWNSNFDEFLSRRAQLMSEALNQLIEDGPNSTESAIMDGREHNLIEAVEIQIRSLINDRLFAFSGENYWNLIVPENVRNKVNQKIGQLLVEHPYLNAADYSPGRKKLDFCDVANYKHIINKNWPQFEEVFNTQDNFIRYLDDFRKYRNLVAHNNQLDVTDVQRKNAEAAIMWLQKSINSFFNQLQQEVDSEQ